MRTSSKMQCNQCMPAAQKNKKVSTSNRASMVVAQKSQKETSMNQPKTMVCILGIHV